MTSVAMAPTYGSALLKHLLLFAVCIFFSPFNSHAQVTIGNPPLQKSSLSTIIVDDYYPYAFVNQNGNPDGFSVDLIRAIAQEMRFDLNIRVDTWIGPVTP